VEQVAPPTSKRLLVCSLTLVRSEERDSTTNAIDRLGGAELRQARASTMAYASELDYNGYIKALARRTSILREWQSLFLQRYPYAAHAYLLAQAYARQLRSERRRCRKPNAGVVSPYAGDLHAWHTWTGCSQRTTQTASPSAFSWSPVAFAKSCVHQQLK
jgi:hypothetical protein